MTNSFDIANFQHQRQSNIGSELYFYGEIDSTNRVAEKIAQQSFREGIAIVADSQSAGRGRNDNAWFSPEGQNLYCTIMLKPETHHLHRIPFIAGLAISKALLQIDLNSDLKWPNDVLVGDKKIGGVLVQSSIEAGVVKYLILGFGLNVNTTEFPSPLNESATSIAIQKNTSQKREKLLAFILEEFEKLYTKMNETSWTEFCGELEKHSSYLRDCHITIRTHEGTIEGVTCGLDPFGGLILKTASGLNVFYSGEVQACRKK